MSKFLYMLESVLLGLRKNYSYTETYLLIHHVSFPIAIWSTINYFPGGHASFIAFANSFTHMIMFGFRFLVVNLFPHWKIYRYRRVVGLILFVIRHFFVEIIFGILILFLIFRWFNSLRFFFTLCSCSSGMIATFPSHMHTLCASM